MEMIGKYGMEFTEEEARALRQGLEYIVESGLDPTGILNNILEGVEQRLEDEGWNGYLEAELEQGE